MKGYKQQIKSLSTFHYFLGGIMAYLSCFSFCFFVMGIAMVTGIHDGLGSDVPLSIFGWFFIIVPGIFTLCGCALSVCIIIAGKKLSRCKNRVFCLVIAGIECTMMPFGTVLGVFTIVTLTNDPVKELFNDIPKIASKE